MAQVGEKVNKGQVIRELATVKEEVMAGEKFAGRAKFIKKIRSMINFLSSYRCSDQVAVLMLKEANSELRGYKR